MFLLSFQFACCSFFLRNAHVGWNPFLFSIQSRMRLCTNLRMQICEYAIGNCKCHSECHRECNRECNCERISLCLERHFAKAILQIHKRRGNHESIPMAIANATLARLFLTPRQTSTLFVWAIPASLALAKSSSHAFQATSAAPFWGRSSSKATKALSEFVRNDAPLVFRLPLREGVLPSHAVPARRSRGRTARAPVRRRR
jgi:hypothetical protein